MLLGILIAAVYVLCTLLSAQNGRVEAAGTAVMDGAEVAVRFVLGITGSLCLWSGFLELLERCGLSAALARLLRPVLSRLFPVSSRQEELFSAITENVSANVLGLGNAATPAGIRAAKGMARLGSAPDELCLFVVLNTASLQLLPTTIASVRAAAGATAAFDILPAVWVSSVISLCCGLLTAALFRRAWP